MYSRRYWISQEFLTTRKQITDHDLVQRTNSHNFRVLFHVKTNLSLPGGGGSDYFSDAGALKAAEIIAFDLLNPTLRSRGGVETATNRYLDELSDAAEENLGIHQSIHIHPGAIFQRLFLRGLTSLSDTGLSFTTALIFTWYSPSSFFVRSK